MKKIVTSLIAVFIISSCGATDSQQTWPNGTNFDTSKLNGVWKKDNECDGGRCIFYKINNGKVNKCEVFFSGGSDKSVIWFAPLHGNIYGLYKEPPNGEKPIIKIKIGIDNSSEVSIISIYDLSNNDDTFGGVFYRIDRSDYTKNEYQLYKEECS